MTPEQEKKFEEWAKNNPELEAKGACGAAWQGCLDANGIDEEPKPSLDDLCKSFESLAYSITKASDKLTEAIERGYEKAEKEKQIVSVGDDATTSFGETGKIVSISENGCYYIQLKNGSIWPCSLEEILAYRENEWLPQEREAVFVKTRDNKKYVSLGTVIYSTGDTVKVRLVNGCVYITSKDSIKPFDASKIGKKWEEI